MFPTRRTLIVLVLGSIAFACTSGQDETRAKRDVEILRPSTSMWDEQSLGCQVAITAWDTLRIVNLPASDTSAPRPDLVRIVGSRVLVAKTGGSKLVAIPIQGDGSKEIELGASARIIDFVETSADEALVTLDSGDVRRVVKVSLGASGAAPPQMVAISDFMASAAAFGPDTLIAIDAQIDRPLIVRVGDRTDSLPLPWAGFQHIDPLGRQLVWAVDSRTRRMAIGFLMGNGWFAFKGTSPIAPNRQYAEHMRFPSVAIKRTQQRLETRLVRSSYSALDMAIDRGELNILFQGTSEHRGKLVDVFEFEGGQYVRTLLLPFRVRSFAVRERNVFVVDSASSMPARLLVLAERK